MDINERPTRQRRRFARVAAAGLAAATTMIVATGAASATPLASELATTGTSFIGGHVSLSRCPGVSPTHVSVVAVSTSFPIAVGSARANSSGNYRIVGLRAGTYKVVPRLDAGFCRYGAWNPPGRQVAAPSSVASFAYSGPSKVVRVSGPVVASALNAAVRGSQLHLDNYGPQHGQSHQLDNGSWLGWGGVKYPFSLPEIQYDLDCGFFCPDIGQARFYVDNLDMSSLTVGWASPALRATLAFESAGREVKGWYTFDSDISDSLDTTSDNLMPDVNIDNARLSVALTPVAEGGRLSYRVASVALAANIQATGACDLGWDVCNFFGDYKAKVKSAIESRVRTKLSDSRVRAFAAAALDKYFTDRGMPTVNRVYIEGNTIVLAA
jgi:hypothetical protein